MLRRGGRAALLLGGALTVLAVAALAGLAGRLVEMLAARLGAAGPLVEAVALASFLSLRGLAAAARRVEARLAAGDLDGARAAVGRDLVSRPTAGLDAGHVASAAIESVAENLTDAFVAPLCWYLAGGLAGAAVYRAVNTADAMFGYRDGTLEHFGKTSARLDDVLNLIPARLAALALVAGAALAGERASRAAATACAEHGRTASPNAGWTMAAMAGALGVTLEKPSAYRLGEGPFPSPPHVARARRVLRASALLALIACAGAEVLIGSIW